jgi:transposase
MNPVPFYVGIDISNNDFAASIFTAPTDPIKTMAEIPNEFSGFEKFESWLINNQVQNSTCVVCLEATGVYGEALSYFLTAKGYQVAVESPLKVKRAFSDKAHKNDKTDSKKISEYAYRYFDELKFWRPKANIVEQIKVLLMAREQLVGQKTALSNTLKVLRKKVVQTPLANDIYKKNVERFSTQIKKIEKELEKLVDKHPDFKNTVKFLDSIPGVGLLLAANFLVATEGFDNEIAFQYRKASAFIGICPYQHSSGTSVYKKPRIPNYGPPRLRKLLHLAARSVVTHNADFSTYYIQKIAQGKARKLILNNVSNKLLKIMCAVTRTQKPFVDNYVSIHPQFALINP